MNEHDQGFKNCLEDFLLPLQARLEEFILEHNSTLSQNQLNDLWSMLENSSTGRTNKWDRKDNLELGKKLP